MYGNDSAGIPLYLPNKSVDAGNFCAIIVMHVFAEAFFIRENNTPLQTKYDK